MKAFEHTIIEELLGRSEIQNGLAPDTDDSEIVEFSGAGYFVTIRDPKLPKDRVVLNQPNIRGKLSGIDVGYLAFVENSELTLECYSYGEEILPKHRDQEFVRDAT